jgi:branched-chain amino acid transport system permease protein
MTSEPQTDGGTVGVNDQRNEQGGQASILELVHPRNMALRHKIGAVIVASMTLAPLGVTPSEMVGVIFGVYLMMLAVSWDFVSGYTGQISLGHTMFFGIGAYAVTILNVEHGVHPIGSFLLAAALAGLLGVLVGIPALRLRGPYLSIVTLVVPLVMIQLVTVFSASLPVLAPGMGLGGRSGFVQEPATFVGMNPSALVTVSSYQNWVIGEFYIALFLLFVTGGFAYAVTRSKTGEIFEAIREDEKAVAAVGLNPAKFKMFAFTASGIIAGVAGAGFALSPAGVAAPDQVLALRISLLVIVTAVLGGMGTIVGAALGVMVFGAFNQLVALIPLSVPFLGIPIGNFVPVPSFVLALIVLYFMPDGILPKLIELGRWVLQRIRGDADASWPERDGTSPVESVVETYREYFRRYLD